jgi:Tol biopolymer transport system component
MSPEQIRGEAADHRSDIFAFALVLHEMVSGRRAFTGRSTVEVMSAILRDDPEPLGRIRQDLPAGLERLVDRCLQKSPDQRYQSAIDLAYQLEAMTTDSGVRPPAADVAPRAMRSWRIPVAAAVLVATILGGAGGFFWGRSTESISTPTFMRLTFRRGTIGSARFAPDGQTIVYDAAWQGDRSELFSARTNGAEARSLELPGSSVFSISSSGEMAIRLPNSTLARMPLAGGAPREILENVISAAWAPDGNTLAVIRGDRARRKLEFPPGKLLYETAGALSSVSVSPDGDLIACAEAALGLASRPSIIVVDLAGQKRVVSENWRAIRGLGWSPDGSEIWFAAAKGDAGGSNLFAVTLKGAVRELTHVPVNLGLLDIARDGRLLLERMDVRLEAIGLLAGDTKERNLSTFDGNGLSDLAPDGRTVILTNAGESGIDVFLRRADASPLVRLGDGGGFALSPDGRWVLRAMHNPPKLALLPTGPGEIRPIDHQPFAGFHWGNWFPDGKRILFVGSEPGHGNRMYVQDLDGGPARAIAPEGVTIQTGSDAISPDGKWVAALGPGRRAALYPTDGGDPRPLEGVVPGDLPTRWSDDGRVLYLFRQGRIPAPIYKLDIATGKKDLWKEVGPNDLAGVTGIGHFQVTPDGAAYAYNFGRTLSDLYLVHGVK